jgi:hypothetical protein
MSIRIDPTKPFKAKLDLSSYVKKIEDSFFGRRYVCTSCGETLIRIELGGILGDELSVLDAAVVLDHELAKHSGS